MGLDVKKTTGTAYKPVFKEILTDIYGGVTIKTGSIPSDVTVLQAGIPINADSSTAGLYNLCKRGIMYAGADSAATSLKLKKNHLFKVEDYVGNLLAGKQISSITRGTSYDTLVVSGIPHTMATNSVIWETSTTNTGRKHSPTALLKQETTVRNPDLSTMNNVSQGAVVRGTVNESLIYGGVTSADKTSLTSRMIWV